jgi:hypothetical protein
MSIDVACPECAKVHKVKEEAAGKKFRCKGCQAVVSIPEAAEISEPDPWDVVDEDAEAPPPMPRRRKAQPAKRSRSSSSSSGSGMPVTVIVSICINALMIVGNLFGIVVNLMMGNLPSVGGVFIRLGIEIAIIKGLVDRSNSYRWQAVALDGVGLGFVLLCIAPAAIFFSDVVGKQMPAEGMAVLAIIFAVQVVLWITDMVMLLSPSAKEFCNQ